MDREEGFAAVEKALFAVKETIESHQGTFKIVMAPKVLTDLDEEEIKKRMELLEAEEEGSSEGEDEEGLVAPKGLDQAADAEEASRKGGAAGGEEEAKKKGKEGGSDEDSD